VQCDGYAPYKKVPADRITVAFCWSHLRREFFKIAERGDAPIATEAVARIGQIYAIEKDVRGKSADERRAARFGLLTVIVTRSGGTRHAR
jgi:transposase